MSLKISIDETITAEETEHATEIPESGKPQVVWLIPRKRRMRGVSSPFLWGKRMVQFVLVILAVYTGFYTAQHQQRSHRKIGEANTYMPAGEVKRISIKYNHNPSGLSRIDYKNDHPGSGRIIADGSQSEPEITLLQSLPADGREHSDQMIIAESRTAIEKEQDFYASQSYYPIESNQSAGRSRFRHLDRQVVEDSLADLDLIRQQVGIKPAETHGHPAGFRVVSIEAGSIFAELGLQSTDIIVGVNGATITTPDQADLLLQSLKAGGDVTIQVKGKRRNRIIHLDIS